MAMRAYRPIKEEEEDEEEEEIKEFGGKWGRNLGDSGGRGSSANEKEEG